MVFFHLGRHEDCSSCRKCLTPLTWQQANVILVSQLVKLALIHAVRAFHLAVLSRCSRFDIGLAYADVFQVSVEFDLKSVTIVSSNDLDSKGGLEMA